MHGIAFAEYNRGQRIGLVAGMVRGERAGVSWRIAEVRLQKFERHCRSQIADCRSKVKSKSKGKGKGKGKGKDGGDGISCGKFS